MEYSFIFWTESGILEVHHGKIGSAHISQYCFFLFNKILKQVVRSLF